MGVLDVLMRRADRINPCGIFYIRAAEESAATSHITLISLRKVWHR